MAYSRTKINAVNGVISSLLMVSPLARAQSYDAPQSAAISTTVINAPQKRMGFAFQDVPVRALLQVLGETAKANIVVDDSVMGTVSLNLKDASWSEALDTVAHIKHLHVEKNNNTYYVSSSNITLNSDPSIGGSDMDGYGGTYGRSEVIELKYQKAEDVRRMISSDGQRLLSKQGAVSADPLTNQLIVQDSPDRVDQIRELIRKIDIPARQVLIEARIVEADDSFSRSLGVKLGFNDASHSGFTSVTDPLDPSKTISVPVRSGAKIGNNMSNVENATGQISNAASSSTIGSMINFPASANSAGTAAANFALSLYSAGLSQFINLEVSALETDGKGKIISSPRVVTSNNVTAVIEQGTEIPYQQQANSSGATSTSFRTANLKLQVTPQITPNGDVVMSVDVSKDTIGTLTSSGYTINTKHVSTQVKIENGGTVVIGGIYQEGSTKSEDKVPFLGDLPLLGYLFKTVNKSITKTELLIFLTPYVLDENGHPMPIKNNEFSSSLPSYSQ